MTENSNKRKRERETNNLSNTESINNPPPTKKRRLQNDNDEDINMVPPTGDTQNWSIDQLKQYLNFHTITFQLNQNKSYYQRLVRVHMLTRPPNSKQNREYLTTVKESSDSSSDQNENEITEFEPQSPSNNANDINASPQSEDSGFNTPPRQATPPLPATLDRTPLTVNTITAGARTPSSTKPKTRSHSASPSLITPSTLKSRPRVQTSTPSSLLNQPPPQQQTINDDPRHQPIVYASNNREPVQITPSQQGYATGHGHGHGATPQVNVTPLQQQKKRYGPFQEIPVFIAKIIDGFASFKDKIFGFMPSFDMSGFMQFIPSNYRFLGVLCLMTIIVLTFGIIPHLIAWIAPPPFCDKDVEYVTNYSVLNGIVPLDKIVSCDPCPYNAFKCENGTAYCGDGERLDDFSVICIKNEETAIRATRLAHQAKSVLSEKLGDYECSGHNESFVYELDENALINEIKQRYYNIVDEEEDISSCTVDEAQKMTDKTDQNEEEETTTDDKEDTESDEGPEMTEKSDQNGEGGQSDKEQDENDQDAATDEEPKMTDISGQNEEGQEEATTDDKGEGGSDEDEPVDNEQDAADDVVETVNEETADDALDFGDIDEENDEIQNEEEEEATTDDKGEGESDENEQDGENDQIQKNMAPETETLTDEKSEANANEDEESATNNDDEETKSVHDTDAEEENEEEICTPYQGPPRITALEFDAAWKYAKEDVIPNAYDSFIVYNETSKTFKSLRPSPTSIICRGKYLKDEYLNINFDPYQFETDINFAYIWSVFLVILCMATIIGIFGKKMINYLKIQIDSLRKPDPQAVGAKNFVLKKLSEQPNISFSIGQIRDYTMRKMKINKSVWDKTLKYINDSGYVEVVAEEVDNAQRMCWKWNNANSWTTPVQ